MNGGEVVMAGGQDAAVAPARESEGARALERSRRAMRALGIMFAGTGLTAASAVVLARVGTGGGEIGLGLVILLASLLVGALLGFLFSLPRVLARPKPSSEVAGSDPGAPNGASDGLGGVGRLQLLETNSNLERISDWLTTVLVGVALADLSKVNDGLLAFRGFVAEFAPCTALSCSILPALAPLLLVIGSVLGFLGMYVYTRIEVARLFRGVETEQQGGDLERPAQRAVLGALRAAVNDADAAGDQPSPATARVRALVAQPATAPGVAEQGLVQVEDGLDAMFDLLYVPGGYRRVIALGKALGGTRAASRPDYWFYLAAAWGQEHAAAILAADDRRVAVAREEAIAAVRRAVKMDPAYVQRVRSLMDKWGTDDDLVTLADDADLRELVGLSPEASR